MSASRHVTSSDSKGLKMIHFEFCCYDINYISVRGRGAGGAAAPLVGKKIVLFGQN